MLDYDVAALLQDEGSNLTVTRPGATTYSAATATVTEAASTTFVLRGLFVNYKDKDVDGTVIRNYDRRFLASARGATDAPQVGDIVAGYRVEHVRAFAPNGIVIAWACQVRSGPGPSSVTPPPSGGGGAGPGPGGGAGPGPGGGG